MVEFAGDRQLIAQRFGVQVTMDYSNIGMDMVERLPNLMRVAPDLYDAFMVFSTNMMDAMLPLWPDEEPTFLTELNPYITNGRCDMSGHSGVG